MCVCVCVFLFDLVSIHITRDVRLSLSISVSIHVCYYGVALVSRIDKIIGLFCKRALQKRQYSAKETFHFIDPTDRSHPISVCVSPSYLCVFARFTRCGTSGLSLVLLRSASFFYGSPLSLVVCLSALLSLTRLSLSLRV